MSLENPIIHLEIHRLLVSGNQLKRGKTARTIRWKYAKYKKGFLKDISILAEQKGLNPAEKIIKKRYVEFTRCIPKGQRVFDDDNLREGFKPIADCLTILNLIHDDSPKWMKADYKQLPWNLNSVGEKGGVQITIWE